MSQNRLPRSPVTERRPQRGNPHLNKNPGLAGESGFLGPGPGRKRLQRWLLRPPLGPLPTS